jgi:spermidine synthase
MMTTPGSKTAKALLYAAFVASGFAGLAYELAWTRAASTWFGISAYAISTILSAFLAGLAVGGWLGGRWLARHPAARPLRAYALAEVGVGLTALGVQAAIGAAEPVMVAIARILPGFQPAGVALRFFAVTALLALPTLFMGASFPLFNEAIATKERSLQRGISLVYAANTLGAATGCAATAWLLLPAIGERSLVVGCAFLNFAAAGVALFAEKAFRSPPRPALEPASAVSGFAPVDEQPRRQALLALGAGSGLVAMACEVIWTRVYSQALRHPQLPINPYLAFSLVLSTILLGMGLGSLVFSRLDRGRLGVSPSTRLAAFGGVQAVLALLDLLVIPSTRHAVLRLLHLPPVPTLNLVINAVMLGMPALALGVCFPLLGSIYALESERVGTRMGELYAANTVAGVFGSLLGGFVLIPVAGIRFSLIWMGGLNALCATIALLMLPGARKGSARFLPVGLGAVLAAAAVFTHDTPENAYQGELRWYKDGVEASTAVTRLPPPERTYILYSNGNAIEGVLSAERVLVPALLARHVSHILLIGFGTGLSAAALLATLPETNVDCVELDDNQPSTVGFFGTAAVLTNPRFHLYIEDGRQFLRRSRQSYDVIIVDSWGQAINQEFYNVDFFRNAADALADDGLFYVKVPAGELSRTSDVDVVIRSIAAGFPYAYLVWAADPVHPALIGRKTRFSKPIPPETRALEPDVLEISTKSRAGIHEIDSTMLGRLKGGRLNTDDRPWFFLPWGRSAQVIEDYVAGLLG